MFAEILFSVEDWVTFWLLMWAATVYLGKLDLVRQLAALTTKTVSKESEGHVIGSKVSCRRSDSSSSCSTEVLTNYSSSTVASEVEEEAAGWGTAISPLQLLDIDITDRTIVLEVKRGLVCANNGDQLSYVLDNFGKKAINSAKVPHDAACRHVCTYTVKAIWDCHGKTRYTFDLVKHYKAVDNCTLSLSSPADIDALCNAARDLW